MNIQDAEPNEYLDLSKPITSNMAGQCEYCDLHSWIELCPKMRCECGSTVTITAIDKLDNKCVRRCFRCNAVEIWYKP